MLDAHELRRTRFARRKSIEVLPPFYGALNAFMAYAEHNDSSRCRQQVPVGLSLASYPNTRSECNQLLTAWRPYLGELNETAGGLLDNPTWFLVLAVSSLLSFPLSLLNHACLPSLSLSLSPSSDSTLFLDTVVVYVLQFGATHLTDGGILCTVTDTLTTYSLITAQIC